MTYYPRAVFPETLYDASRFDDFLALLNLELLETSAKQLAVDLKLGAPATEANGYRNELDEAKWKPFKPGKDGCKLACDRTVRAGGADGGEATYVVTTEHGFPALPLLEEALASLPAETKLIVVMMPAHIWSQPRSAQGRANLELCKRRIAAMTASRSGYAVDFDIASPWTRNAENYWDSSHFRVNIAKDFVLRLKEAVEGGRDADDGVYRYLAGPRASATTAR
jgi:hypothetical protein